LGREEALALAAEGARVIVNDLGVSVTGEGADKRTADEVVDVIKGRGGEAVANYDDVADFNGAKSIIDTAVEAFGKLDVLVNNAGILRDKMLFTMGEDEFDSVIRVHLKGTWSTMHHASAYWRTESKEGRQPSGSIVNTVSSAGLQGQASQINYGAAKAGIAAMTIIASLELKRYGVRANCIGPGGATRMVAQAMKIDVKNPEDYTEFENMNPGNSAPGVVWLASDESLHVTGQVLRLVEQPGRTRVHRRHDELFVPAGERTFRRVDVTLGIESRGMVEITSGLKAGAALRRRAGSPRGRPRQ
jgi:NAD(P)-dependent dehydrogenase (short-subunit alcohol dehydrogenase family)